jgi:hypothetical protein
VNLRQTELLKSALFIVESNPTGVLLLGDGPITSDFKRSLCHMVKNENSSFARDINPVLCEHRNDL